MDNEEADEQSPRRGFFGWVRWLYQSSLGLTKRIGDRVWLVQCLTYFDWPSHKSAIRKLLVLWIVTSSPILIAVLLSPMPLGADSSFFSALVKRVSESFSVSEHFVYAVAFMAPIMYILFERYAESTEVHGSERLRLILKVFRGYGVVVIIATVLLICTAAAFSAIKSEAIGAAAGEVGGDPALFKSTFLYFLLVESSVYIYLFGVYCWYLSILDGLRTGGDFVSATRDEEKDARDGLSRRVAQGESR